MASHCPKCATETDEDFGLVQCSECGHQFLAGEPAEISEKNTASEMENFSKEQPLTSEVDMSLESGVSELEDLGDQAPSIDTNTQDSDSVESEADLSFEPKEQTLELNAHTANEEEAKKEDEPTKDSAVPLSYNQMAEAVEGFANQSLLESSSATYDLKITGIDSLELNKALKTILSYSQLELDVNKILSAKKSGYVKVQALSIAKTIFLVHKLQALPLEVSWSGVEVALEEKLDPDPLDPEDDDPVAEDF